MRVMRRPPLSLTFSLLPFLVSSWKYVTQSSRGGWFRQAITIRVPPRQLYSSSSSSDPSSIDEINNPIEQNNRFWRRKYEVNWSDVQANSSAATVISKLESALKTGELSIPKAENAIIIIPQHHLLVPMHNNVLQTHHASVSKEITAATNPNTFGKLDIIVCGFHPRARQITESFEDTERKLHPERRLALDEALQRLYGVHGPDLLADPYLGTTPSRIYRSFICPHPRAVFTIEPVERAAERAAKQIELALRQVRADQSSYLRNTDQSPLIAQTTRHPVVLVLDNLRSAFNVGSIFRTAETGGVREVVTCGITPHPPHPKLKKTAFSAVDSVPSRHFDDIMQAISTLREEGYQIIVLETTSLSKDYDAIEYPEKVALVLGNEITGVDARVIEQADLVAEIPTFGHKNSLNVASVAPIMVFEVLRQWRALEKLKKND
jgi:23S rRNA (guanosine2251-2'-O)-methyltransferase